MTLFSTFICDFLEFPSVKSSKILTVHRIRQDTNFTTKKVGFVQTVFSIFANLCLFSLCKNWSDFPEKRAPKKVKYLLPACQILG